MRTIGQRVLPRLLVQVFDESIPVSLTRKVIYSLFDICWYISSFFSWSSSLSATRWRTRSYCPAKSIGIIHFTRLTIKASFGESLLEFRRFPHSILLCSIDVCYTKANSSQSPHLRCKQVLARWRECFVCCWNCGSHREKSRKTYGAIDAVDV